MNDTEAQRGTQIEGNVNYRQSIFVIQSSKRRWGCKNYQPKRRWICAENSSAENTHNKLKNGLHAETAWRRCVSVFLLLQAFILAGNSRTAAQAIKQLIGLMMRFMAVAYLLRNTNCATLLQLNMFEYKIRKNCSKRVIR